MSKDTYYSKIEGGYLLHTEDKKKKIAIKESKRCYVLSLIGRDFTLLDKHRRMLRKITNSVMPKPELIFADYGIKEYKKEAA